MARPKGTAGETAETIERVTAIITLMVKGAKTEEILKYGGQTWQLKPRRMEYLIAKAKDALRNQAATVREEQIGLALARFNDLYKEMVRLQDYKGALYAQREICTLLGLTAPTRIDLDASRSFLGACAQADAWFKDNASELKARLTLGAAAGPEREGDPDPEA